MTGEAATHFDDGVYATVKLRTKSPTLNVDYEVEANPTDRPSDTGKNYADKTDPNYVHGTEKTGMGAGAGSIIKVDGSIISAPTSIVDAAGNTITDRVMSDANGHELIKVERTERPDGSKVTTMHHDTYDEATDTSIPQRTAKREVSADGKTIVVTLKSYKNGQVEWSLVKTFKKSQITDTVESTEAKLYTGDVDAGATNVVTEKYSRTNKVTLTDIVGGGTPETAVGTTFYTRQKHFEEAEAGYTGVKYVKRVDSASGKDIYLPEDQATPPATTTEPRYKHVSELDVYTPVPYTFEDLERAYKAQLKGDDDAKL